MENLSEAEQADIWWLEAMAPGRTAREYVAAARWIAKYAADADNDKLRGIIGARPDIFVPDPPSADADTALVEDEPAPAPVKPAAAPARRGESAMANLRLANGEKPETTKAVDQKYSGMSGTELLEAVNKEFHKKSKR